MKTLNLTEAAAFLKVSDDTLKDLAQSGAVPGAKVGKCWLFVDEDLEQYVREVVRRQTAERRGVTVPQRIATEATRIRRRRNAEPPSLQC